MKHQELPIETLRPKAEAGDCDSQFGLGICYVHGRGVEQDYREAVRWLRAAALQGHAGAQDSLGVRFATGQGVPQNDTEAVRWFRKAAEAGLAVAQFNLALAYVYGQGVPQNYAEAYVWFSLSALQGDEIAAESRDRVAEAFSYEALQEAKLLFHRRLRERRGVERRVIAPAPAEGLLAAAC